MAKRVTKKATKKAAKKATKKAPKKKPPTKKVVKKKAATKPLAKKAAPKVVKAKMPSPAPATVEQAKPAAVEFTATPVQQPEPAVPPTQAEQAPASAQQAQPPSETAGPKPITQLIDDYLAGPRLLRQAVAGMDSEQLLARPVPGKWSTLEVICHVADFEIVYADRIKRVIAENEPTMLSGDPDVFAARLAYHERDPEEELLLIETIRKQVARILRTLKPEDFQRRGIHLESGPLTLETLTERLTGHIPHHVRFIEEKRKALALIGG